MLAAVWPGRTGDRVLDVPCGAGRVADYLERELGARAVGADRSRAMLGEARDAGPEGRLLVHADADSRDGSAH